MEHKYKIAFGDGYNLKKGSIIELPNSAKALVTSTPKKKWYSRLIGIVTFNIVKYDCYYYTIKLLDNK